MCLHSRSSPHQPSLVGITTPAPKIGVVRGERVLWIKALIGFQLTHTVHVPIEHTIEISGLRETDLQSECALVKTALVLRHETLSKHISSEYPTTWIEAKYDAICVLRRTQD